MGLEEKGVLLDRVVKALGEVEELENGISHVAPLEDHQRISEPVIPVAAAAGAAGKVF